MAEPPPPRIHCVQWWQQMQENAASGEMPPAEHLAAFAATAIHGGGSDRSLGGWSADPWGGRVVL